MAVDIGTVDYNQAIAAVSNYYQTDPGNVINIINEYNLTPEQLYQTLPTTDNLWNVTYSNSGAVLGTDSVANIQYAGATQAAEAAAAMNSNVATASQASKTLTNVPAQTTIDAQSGNVTMSRGVTSAATGNTFLAVADKIGLGVVGVSIGTKLGAFIDSAIYNAAPDYWDATYPTINPQTWDSIATTSGGKQFIRGLFGISGNESGMYIPEDVFAYYALAMAKEGFFNTGGYTPPPGYIIPSIFNTPIVYSGPNFIIKQWNTNPIIFSATGTGTIVSCGFMCQLPSSALTWMVLSDEPFTLTINGTQVSSSSAQWNGYRYYWLNDVSWYIENTTLAINIVADSTYGNISGSYQTPYVCYFHGEGGDAKEGVTPQPGATYPTIDPNASVADVLAQLKTLYPDLWDKAITESVVQPDGTTKHILMFLCRSLKQITYVIQSQLTSLFHKMTI